MTTRGRSCKDGRMEISWPTVIISSAVSACTGGLAGAIFTRFASVGLQKKVLQAQARAGAIKLVSDWISVVYDLYWTNESTYAGGGAATRCQEQPEPFDLSNRQEFGGDSCEDSLWS